MVTEKLGNFTKSPNFIRQTSYSSATIIRLFCQIDLFTFSPNFSLTKLLSYMVVTEMPYTRELAVKILVNKSYWIKIWPTKIRFKVPHFKYYTYVQI